MWATSFIYRGRQTAHAQLPMGKMRRAWELGSVLFKPIYTMVCHNVPKAMLKECAQLPHSIWPPSA